MILEVDIFGIPVPDTSPLFLVSLAVHVIAGLTCVLTGFVAILVRKATPVHPSVGKIYHHGMLVILMTSILLAIVRWPLDNHLLVLGSVAYLLVFLARRARRKGWRQWPRWHLLGMGLSYVVLLTAFYVDNGPHLPLWKNLPSWVFWALPSAVGTPLLALGFFLSPLTRSRKRS